MTLYSEAYDKALSTGLVQKDVEEIVPLCLTRAGLLKRILEANDFMDGGEETLFKIVEDGIAMVRTSE